MELTRLSWKNTTGYRRTAVRQFAEKAIRRLLPTD